MINCFVAVNWFYITPTLAAVFLFFLFFYAIPPSLALKYRRFILNMSPAQRCFRKVDEIFGKRESLDAFSM